MEEVADMDINMVINTATIMGMPDMPKNNI